MDKALFERLLYEEENSLLDFKEGQYRFVKAGEDEKSELLKDILGFANAWRRSEAYILIGVEDIRGGRGNVKGIADAEHLDDHSLQQFVNNLTNRPVRFHYEAFGFESKQVGIIRIEEQARPIYLKRDYGKLKKEKIYVRRGSSTDPTKPASPEEIAQMGASPGQPTAEILVEFADTNGDNALGKHIALETEICQIPTREEIPNLERPKKIHPQLGIDLANLCFDLRNNLNTDYFRERAWFELQHRFFQPIRLVVKNIGQVAANNVHVELGIPIAPGLGVKNSSEMPNPPRRKNEIFTESFIKSIRSASQEPGETTLDQNTDRVRIDVHCGNIQPGRRVWSEVFYMCKHESGELSLFGSIFADNLPQPKELELIVSASVIKTQMTVEDLCSLPELEE
ncbi:MAG: hypothetical protein BA869_01435 [Desulfuromonadales bacterium C00003107]|nr:MAG: hypothetical protein BA869_01435 [Desulfuromonadales bacterium C00003107]